MKIFQIFNPMKSNEKECECKAPIPDFDNGLELYCVFCHGYIEMYVDE